MWRCWMERASPPRPEHICSGTPALKLALRPKRSRFPKAGVAARFPESGHICTRRRTGLYRDKSATAPFAGWAAIGDHRPMAISSGQVGSAHSSQGANG